MLASGILKSMVLLVSEVAITSITHKLSSNTTDTVLEFSVVFIFAVIDKQKLIIDSFEVYCMHAYTLQNWVCASGCSN